MMRQSFSRRISYFFTSLLILGLAFGTTLPRESGAASGTSEQNTEQAMQANNRLERTRGAIAVHQRHWHRLMQIADVVGSGIGLGSDNEPIIKVFTARRGVPGIPDMLEGVRVHTEVSGRLYAIRSETCDANNPPTSDGICTTAERWPLPVPTGVSVGHPAITAGSIAARVTDGTSVFILSNNHVLANVNQAAIGDPILQPGPFDGGVNPGDIIANLTDFEPIKFCTVWLFWIICNETNVIDAAIASSTSSAVGFSTPIGQFNSVPGYGSPISTPHPAYGNPNILGDENLAQLLGVSVQKFGRTTRLTTGSISTISATVDVCYDADCMNIARFTDQLIVTPGTFSGGGDSGSLVVDSLRQPVGLLFAGSDTLTIINRIDLVLNRFGIAVDGGTVNEPVIDIAVTGVDVPTPVRTRETATVRVTVENRGQKSVSGVMVRLDDLTEGGTVETQPVNADFIPGESKSLEFLWTPTTGGSHTLEASHQLTDDNPSNNTYRRDVNVLLPPSGPQLQLWKGLVYTDRWTTVQLDYEYGDEMVVVCSPNYDLSAPGPAIVKVRNAQGSSFEVGIGRPWYGTLGGEDFSAKVYCMVLRQGVYSVAEDGVKMEAVKLPGFTLTDHAGSWSGQHQVYQNSYNRPVVIGQVVSPDTGKPPSDCQGLICEPDWSVFWSRGTAVTNPPSSSALYVGRHTGEDPTDRAPETLAYLVIETGTGTVEGRKYVAALGADTVRGMRNKPPYPYSISGLSSASTAIVSQAGMDGADGGWAVLFGPNAVSATRLRLAIDEDWYLYSERNHTTEQVSYIVFE